MLIHVLPKLYVPGGLDAAVRLVDLTIEETGLVLKGDQDLTIRRPYPNKCYWVGCRKVGQKAVAGLSGPRKAPTNHWGQITGGGRDCTRPPPLFIRRGDQARSKRSASITLTHAATKSRTNFALLSSWA